MTHACHSVGLSCTFAIMTIKDLESYRLIYAIDWEVTTASKHSYWQLASVLVREQKDSNQDTKSLRRFCSPECLQLLLLYNLGISVLLYSKKRPIHTLVSATRLPAVVMSLLALDAAHKSNSKHNSMQHEPLPEDSLCSNQARQQLW